MARILCVGIATLDIVNTVASYPPEDSEVRALSQQVRAGGNAANTARVLAQLGADTHWVGNLSDQPQAQVVRDAFAHAGVDASRAKVCEGAAMPTSYVTLSKANGSRSIVHYRDMPEYAAEDFLQLDIRSFDWVHFEGRALEQLQPMMERARGMCGVPISLEVEKPREGIEALFDEADILFFSRDYALQRGFDEAAALLEQLPRGALATCTWGEQGAWVRDFEGTLLHEPAHAPAEVVDTLGAGDVFNAGMLHAVSSGMPIAEALRSAVRLAGEQCGREGMELSDA
jgi:ketohexokinase